MPPCLSPAQVLWHADATRVQAERTVVASTSALLTADPSLVNAYVYPPGAGSGQAAQQGPAVPTTTPAYSSYQPTPTQGYQASTGVRAGATCPVSAARSLHGRAKGLVSPGPLAVPLLSLGGGWGLGSPSWWQRRGESASPEEPSLPAPALTPHLSSPERGLAGAEHSGHLPGPPVRRHGLHGWPVGLHGLPALWHAGEHQRTGPTPGTVGMSSGHPPACGAAGWEGGALAEAVGPHLGAACPPAPLTVRPRSPQGLMSALPGQDAALSSLPPQQSYLPGQQPLYQQVSAAARGVWDPGAGGCDG